MLRSWRTNTTYIYKLKTFPYMYVYFYVNLYMSNLKFTVYRFYFVNKNFNRWFYESRATNFGRLKKN